MIGSYILQGASALINMYYFAMLFYIISSWVPPLRENFFGRFIDKIVDPYLSIFRKIIPPLGMIDISPILAFLAYNFLSRYLLEGIAFLVRITGV